MLKQDFKKIINSIKEEIRTTQIRTILETNRNLIMLYFRLGKIIDKSSKYGNKFIEQTALELRLDFPNMKGFSIRNLKYMKKFYNEYKNEEKMQQLVAQLPWGHNILLIEKIKDKNIRKMYIEKTIENGWSRNVLSMQIESNYHLRLGNSSNNFNSTLNQNSDLINNIVKDPYIFDFIALKENFKEKELESKMITRIRDVLLELGNGFSFVGNQYKLTIADNDYFIDLLFYHLKLKCYVIVELKATKYIPEYVGKMNFYLNAVDDMIKDTDDNQSIGLILCKEKDKLTANYSLKGINKPIGISSYQISKFTSEDILKTLPTEEELNTYINIDE